MKRTLFKIAGFCSLGAGFLGVFLPVLPTTPFLLLAAFCFARSSPGMNRWMLTNRMFGGYLRNYKAGRGIPLPVKITVLTVLWASILGTAMFIIDPLWLKILLIAIATGVTIHLVRLKTMRRTKILVISPTEGELTRFAELGLNGVKCEICGVGQTEAAVNTMKLIDGFRPSVVILAGIAGAYPGSGLATGDVVLVASETDADTGSFSGGSFEPKFSKTILCNCLPKEYPLPAVASNTVSSAANPYVNTEGVQIENMEGSAFFRACEASGVPFVEIRAVSNAVGEPFEQWDIPLATRRLSAELKKLINEI